MIRWKWDAEVEQWVHYNTHLACTCVGWLGRTSLLSNAKRIFVSKVEFHRWLPTIEPIFLLCNVGEDRIFSFKSSCRISRLLQSELLAFQTPHNGAINWTNRMNKIHAANTQNGCFIARVLGWADRPEHMRAFKVLFSLYASPVTFHWVHISSWLFSGVEMGVQWLRRKLDWIDTLAHGKEILCVCSNIIGYLTHMQTIWTLIDTYYAVFVAKHSRTVLPWNRHR